MPYYTRVLLFIVFSDVVTVCGQPDRIPERKYDSIKLKPLSKLQSQTLKYTTKHFEDKKHFEHPVILQIT